MYSDGICLLWDHGSAAIDGLASQQDDGQIQILTVGHPTTEEAEGEPVMSCTQSQSKQDLRVTMLKKGTVSVLPEHNPESIFIPRAFWAAAVVCCWQDGETH